MSIKEDWLKLKEKNPYWSDIICLNTIINNKKYNKSEILSVFKLCKDDYDKSEKNNILKYLFSHKMPQNARKT